MDKYYETALILSETELRGLRVDIIENYKDDYPTREVSLEEYVNLVFEDLLSQYGVELLVVFKDGDAHFIYNGEDFFNILEIDIEDLLD